MKKIIITLIIMLTVMSCKSQDLKVYERLGTAVGLVTQVTEDGISTVQTQSKTLEVDGRLDKNKEYRLIYLITDCGSCKIVRVKLIRAEFTANQAGLNVADMMKEYKIRTNRDEGK